MASGTTSVFFSLSRVATWQTHQGLSRHAVVRLPWGFPHGFTASLLGRGVGMAGDGGGLSPASVVSCSSARQPADCRHAPHWRTCWASAAPLGKDLPVRFSSHQFAVGHAPLLSPRLSYSRLYRCEVPSHTPFHPHIAVPTLTPVLARGTPPGPLGIHSLVSDWAEARGSWERRRGRGCSSEPAVSASALVAVAVGAPVGGCLLPGRLVDTARVRVGVVEGESTPRLASPCLSNRLSLSHGDTVCCAHCA